jgi:uncharacterized protein with GYD domain
MSTYILLMNLSAEGRESIREKPDRINSHNDRLESMGVKVLAQYATLGQYDFVSILEAPNEDAIFKAAVNLSGRGTAQVQTLSAKPVNDFVAIVKK